MKEILIFVASFILSFALFVLLSRAKISLPLLPKTGFDFAKKATPTPSPTLIPTPTPSFKKDELKIKILNGSGTKGKATDVKDILKDKGYGEILTGNADNFDYTQSTIEVKENRQEAVNWLKNDLKESVSDFKISTLAEDQAADLILIIGQDFK